MLKIFLRVTSFLAIACLAPAASADPSANAVFKPLQTFLATACGTGCTNTVNGTLVVNTQHLSGQPTSAPPATGSVEYCEFSLTRASATTSSWSTSGALFRNTDRRDMVSQDSPLPTSGTYPFAFRGDRCDLTFDIDKGTLAFTGETAGAVATEYDLRVENDMLVGTRPGFTAIVLFAEVPGTPNDPTPMTCEKCREEFHGVCKTVAGQIVCLRAQ